MKARWLTLFLMLVAALAATTKFAYDFGKTKQPGKVIEASCPDLAQACRVKVDGGSIEIAFAPQPVLLKPIMLTVTAPAVREMTATFSMVGMDMGINRYRLQSIGDGKWQARVILPACISRRTDWMMTLDVGGNRVKLPFSAAKAGG